MKCQACSGAEQAVLLFHTHGPVLLAGSRWCAGFRVSGPATPPSWQSPSPVLLPSSHHPQAGFVCHKDIILNELILLGLQFSSAAWQSYRHYLAASASVVASTEVGHRAVALARALLEVCGPVHALPVWEAGKVGVTVDTHLLIVAPHAQPARTVGAAVRQIFNIGGLQARLKLKKIMSVADVSFICLVRALQGTGHCQPASFLSPPSSLPLPPVLVTLAAACRSLHCFSLLQ